MSFSSSPQSDARSYVTAAAVLLGAVVVVTGITVGLYYSIGVMRGIEVPQRDLSRFVVDTLPKLSLGSDVLLKEAHSLGGVALFRFVTVTQPSADLGGMRQRALEIRVAVVHGSPVSADALGDLRQLVQSDLGFRGRRVAEEALRADSVTLEVERWTGSCKNTPCDILLLRSIGGRGVAMIATDAAVSPRTLVELATGVEQSLR